MGYFEINISRAESDLEQRMKMAGINDGNYTKMMVELQNSTTNSDEPDISIDKEGLLRFKNRLYIPDSAEIKLNILEEVHKETVFWPSRLPKNNNNTQKNYFTHLI
jgi:hypothetical protein